MCAGAVDISTTGKIFDSIRPKCHFFHCPQCIGFHVGWIMFLAFWYSGIRLFPNIYLGLPLYGFLSSFTSNFFVNLFDDEGIRINREPKE